MSNNKTQHRNFHSFKQATQYHRTYTSLWPICKGFQDSDKGLANYET